MLNHFLLLLVLLLIVSFGNGFAVVNSRPRVTALHAIGVLARKAKEAEIRTYCQEGVEDAVMEQYKKIQANDDTTSSVGPLQKRLTKRKGTISVIAEYKRKLEFDGYIQDIFDPEVLSPTFREFGASGIAVLADKRMGGCDYHDLQSFLTEQKRAALEIPGPVMVINHDFIVDEIQIARTAAMGAHAVVLVLGAFGENTERVSSLMRASRALNLEAIVAVSTVAETERALELGATMVMVQADDMNDKETMLQVCQTKENVCAIAYIGAQNNKALEEIEEAWMCRDQGFQSVWVSDVLYKSGNDPSEHPGAILRSITAKSSVKWASPKARAGRGEGAREYLGDILM